VESRQSSESIIQEGLDEPLGHEKVIPRNLNEVPEFLAVEHQFNAVGGKPHQHPDGVTTPWAMGGIPTIDGIELIYVSIVPGPEDAFLQDKEAG
jgi:hypothetical protein